jgi:hypothetical protein
LNSRRFDGERCACIRQRGHSGCGA